MAATRRPRASGGERRGESTGERSRGSRRSPRRSRVRRVPIREAGYQTPRPPRWGRPQRRVDPGWPGRSGPRGRCWSARARHCLVMAVWALSPTSVGDSGAAWRAVGLTWLGAHQTALTISGLPVTVLPLGAVLPALLLTRRGGSWAARFIPEPTVRELGALLAGAAAVYGAGGAGVAWLCGTPSTGATRATPSSRARPSPWLDHSGASSGDGTAPARAGARPGWDLALGRRRMGRGVGTVHLWCCPRWREPHPSRRGCLRRAGRDRRRRPGARRTHPRECAHPADPGDLGRRVRRGPGVQPRAAWKPQPLRRRRRTATGAPGAGRHPSTAPAWAPALLVPDRMRGAGRSSALAGRSPSWPGALVSGLGVGVVVAPCVAAGVVLTAGSLGGGALTDIGPDLGTVTAAAVGLVVVGFLGEAAGQSLKLTWEVRHAGQRHRDAIEEAAHSLREGDEVSSEPGSTGRLTDDAAPVGASAPGEPGSEFLSHGRPLISTVLRVGGATRPRVVWAASAAPGSDENRQPLSGEPRVAPPSPPATTRTAATTRLRFPGRGLPRGSLALHCSLTLGTGRRRSR